MSKKQRLTDAEAARYGFRWGPVDVVRYTDDMPRGYRVLGVETAYDSVQILVSRTGRSIRVYRGEKQLREIP